MLHILLHLPDKDDALEFEADYLSSITGGTYGPPAVAAPSGGRPPLAKEGDLVVYVNTDKVTAAEVTRLRDA